MICNGIHYIFLLPEAFIALSTCFCLSVAVLLIPYSVHFLQCLQLIVAVRNIFLGTQSSEYIRFWHSIIPISSLYSAITHAACKHHLLGSMQDQGALFTERMDYVGFHYKTSQDNWSSWGLSLLLVYCEEWCPHGEYVRFVPRCARHDWWDLVTIRSSIVEQLLGACHGIVCVVDEDLS